jgi:hypothetical protein
MDLKKFRAQFGGAWGEQTCSNGKPFMRFQKEDGGETLMSFLRQFFR